MLPSLLLSTAIATLPPGCFLEVDGPLTPGVAIAASIPSEQLEGRLICNESGQSAVIAGGRIGPLLAAPPATVAPPQDEDNPLYALALIPILGTMFGLPVWLASRHGKQPAAAAGPLLALPPGLSEEEFDAVMAIRERALPPATEPPQQRSPVEPVPAAPPVAPQAITYNQQRTTVQARNIHGLNLGAGEDEAIAVDDVPTVDIAGRIRSYAASCLVFAAPNSGKTVLLRQVLAGLPSGANVAVIDPKNSLWPEGVKVYPAHSPELAAGCIQVLESFYSLLQQRVASRHQQTKPYPEQILVIDELLGWLEDLKDWDTMSGKDEDKLYPRALSLFKQLLTKGREDRVRVIAISHSPLVKDIGLSSSMLRTLAMVSLGRQQSSNLLIETVAQVIPTPSRSKTLALLDAAIAQSDDQVVALWCEGGGQVCYLPNYVEQQRGMALAPAVGVLDQRSDRQRLEAALAAPSAPELEPETVDPFEAELLRFLATRPNGVKPRDAANSARQPVKGSGVDMIRDRLSELVAKGMAYEFEGTYFLTD